MPQPDDVGAASAALRELAEALAGLGTAPLPANVATLARQRLFDTLGAAQLGLHTREGRLLADYEQRASFAPQEPASLACKLHVGAARATEIDDIDIESCTTVGAVVVPAALAAATARRSTNRGVLAAVVAGYEAMMRLGRAIGGATLLYRGVWPTYVTAAFGAAAAASRALDLDAAATARALALAATRTAAVPSAALAQVGYRYYALGCAAADGLDAAVAAAAGVGAEPDALAAYARRIGAEIDLTQLTVSLGSPWLVGAVDTKPWPTSRQALASVVAFRRLDLAPESLAAIERITAFVPAAYRSMVDRAVPPATRIESMIGVQFQLALAALAPERLYDDLRTSLPLDSKIIELMRKVEVHADEELSARFPRHWGSRVVVRLGSGAELTGEALEPEGSAREPLAWTALECKLERIHAASGLAMPGWVSSLRSACEGVGVEDEELGKLLAVVAKARAGAAAQPRGAHGS